MGSRCPSVTPTLWSFSLCSPTLISRTVLVARDQCPVLSSEEVVVKHTWPSMLHQRRSMALSTTGVSTASPVSVRRTGGYPSLPRLFYLSDKRKSLLLKILCANTTQTATVQLTGVKLSHANSPKYNLPSGHFGEVISMDTSFSAFW